MDYSTEVVKEADFSGMFPRLSHEFYIISREKLGDPLDNRLSHACKNFCNVVKNNYNFNVNCINLGRFLNFINRSSDDNHKKHSCRYFFYKLKLELKQKSIECGEIRSCYGTLINILRNELFLNGTYTCSQYIADLDDEAFPIFNKLDLISDYTYKLILGDTCWEDIKYDKYIKELTSSKYMEDKHFYDAFETVFNDYKKYCPRSNAWLPPFAPKKKEESIMKPTLSETPTSDILENILYEGPGNMVLERTSSKQMSAIGVDSEVISGLFITLFLIISILFILYKYTNYYSVLQLWIRKVKTCSTKNILNMMISFERERNNSVYDRLKIAYNIEDYQ
ncbi:variable surface protein [Plasmodium gonderi]|uniref:Variable surface protein n=1 Tax=Plasmodium gonderi TaxID=77519 RepID=A0A1Y1JT12_PLAGO|nr:variable surface protein [Plasmodium gonderi]GAW84595.1 variable surface protein [Plasmodium gonderi]